MSVGPVRHGSKFLCQTHLRKNKKHNDFYPKVKSDAFFNSFFAVFFTTFSIKWWNGKI